MSQIYNRIYTPELYEQVSKENKDIIEDFIREMKSRKKSEGTLKQYKNDLRCFAIWLVMEKNGKSILDLKKRDYRDFMIYCDEEWHWSNQRTNRVMSAIRMMNAFLEDDEDEYEDFDRSPAAKIKGLQKQPVREIEFLDDGTVLALAEELADMGDYKKATLVALLYDTGSRVNEIAQVEKESFYDDSKNLCNKVKGKRSKYYRPVYHSLTKKYVKKYLDQRGEDDIKELFITDTGTAADTAVIYDWIVNMRPLVAQITGKECNMSPHSFRHSYIQNLSDGTHYLCREGNLGKVPLDKIKILVNHSDLTTTDSYRKDTSMEEIGELFGIDMED